MIQIHGHGNLKSNLIFSLQDDILGTLLCLMVVGVGSISRMLVILQKTKM